MPSPIRIDHSELYKPFLDHLSDENNNRVLFSAPFGNGKTSFLHEFFIENSRDFIHITLFPVNYSTASSKDVFELIKYDILFTVLGTYKNEADLKKEKYSLLLTSQMLLLQNVNGLKITSLLGWFIAVSELIGKPINPIVPALKNLVSGAEDFQNKVNEDPQKLVEKYFSEFENQTGNLNEFDTISRIISEIIANLKTKDGSNKKSVLVIDDLDRLDPDHIFRLFNVFSAHHDLRNNHNKFGFDKVIFVCDVSNIRKIFHNRYGKDVDFTGYIDKFYSSEVFSFENVHFIKHALSDIINSIPYQESVTNRYSIHSGTRLYHIFEWIVFSLLENKLINLRSIVTLNQITLPKYQFSFVRNSRKYQAFDFGILIIFHILKQFWGSTEIVKEKLKSLTDSRINAPRYLNNHKDEQAIETDVLNVLLPFILDVDQVFPPSRKPADEKFSSYYEKGGYYIHFSYFNGSSDTRRSEPYIVKITSNGGISEEEHLARTYAALYDVYSDCMLKEFVQ